MVRTASIVTIIIGAILFIAGLIWLAVIYSNSTKSKTGSLILISLGLVIFVVGIAIFLITKDKKIKVKDQ